jgi:hypothetical protein
MNEKHMNEQIPFLYTLNENTPTQKRNKNKVPLYCLVLYKTNTGH